MKTAHIPTVPESEGTIAIQVQQLKDGIRNVVMFPKGTPTPGKARDIGMREIVTGGSKFWHNPAKIKASEISSAVKHNILPKILGGPSGYGAPDKSELRGSTMAVVAKAASGTPAQDIATDAPHFVQAVEAAKEVRPIGGSVTVEPVGAVISQRKQHLARKAILQKVTQLAASGDVHGALKLGAKHSADGTITDSQMDKALQMSGPQGLGHAFNAIQDLHHAISIYQKAAPEEQAVFRPHLLTKLHGMESAPQAEQHATLSKLAKHGLLPPTISQGVTS